MKPPTPEEKQTDTAWMIDRFLYSRAYGTLASKFLPLIIAPGQRITKYNMTGAVGHGKIVEIIDQKEIGGVMWFKCKHVAVNKGKEHLQEGWCESIYLYHRGKHDLAKINVVRAKKRKEIDEAQKKLESDQEESESDV